MNKMKKIKLFILCSTLVIIFCSDWEGKREVIDGVVHIYNNGDGLWEFDKEKKIEFEKLMDIGKKEGNPNYIFNRISSVVIDNGMNLYIYDSMKKEIKKFDKDGNFILKFEKNNKTGFDFSGYELLNTFKEKLYIYDIVNSRFLWFSLNGEFIGEKDIKSYEFFMERNLKVISDNKIVTLSLLYEEPGMHVVFYDNEFNVKEKLDLSAETGFKFLGGYPDGFSFDFLNNEFISQITPFAYEIRIYDLIGNLKYIVKKEDKYFTMPAIENMPVINGTVFGPLYELSDGKKMLFVNHQYGKVWIDLYNEKWQYLKKIRYPEGFPLIMGEDNTIYFKVKSPYSHLAKYRINILEGK